MLVHAGTESSQSGTHGAILSCGMAQLVRRAWRACVVAIVATIQLFCSSFISKDRVKKTLRFAATKRNILSSRVFWSLSSSAATGVAAVLLTIGTRAVTVLGS